ncbi:MAG: STT3 domain-containing protein, partial [Candidatus Bathyarchaeia archaeon]
MASKVKNAASKLLNRVPTLNRIFRKVPKETLILTLCLALIVGIAVAVRVLPYNWGYQLSEFDPYFHYDVTEYVVKNGFSSWFDWHTDRAWYPTGRDIGLTSFPGLPFSSAILYLFLTGIGVQTTVYNVSVAFPVLMAALTCIVMYYFGKDVGGPKVGLLAALFLALSPAFIARTSLGFFDTESVGIFGILLASLFYLRSLDEEKGKLTSLAYSLLGGLFLGYVFASWGASRYAMSLLALFTFVLIIAKRYSQRLLISYGVLTTTSFLIAIGVPKLGFPFLTEFECIAVFGV